MSESVPELKGEVVLSPNHNYKKRDAQHPDYQIDKLTPTTSDEFKLNDQSTIAERTFLLPDTVFNLAQSVLAFDLVVPIAEALKYGNVYRGTLPIQQMSLSTKSGTFLMNFSSDFDKYVDMLDSEVSLGELQSGDKTNLAYPCDAPVLENAKNSEAKTGVVAYRERKYNNLAPVGAAQTVKYRIKLGSIKECVLALDKSMYYGQPLNLRIVFGKMSTICTQANDDVFTTPVAPATNKYVNFENLVLYLATEKNQGQIDRLMGLGNSQAGYSVIIPYSTVISETKSGAQQNIKHTIGIYHGQTVKRIKSAFYHTTPATPDLYYSRLSTKLQSYYSLLNNKRLQPFNVDVANGDAYMMLKNKLKGTPIYNQAVYNNNFFIEDDFTNGEDKDTNVLTGLSLEKELIYDLFCTTAVADNTICTVVHCQKTLSISSNGIVVQ